MMWGGNYATGMMGWGQPWFGTVHTLFWIIIFVDLVLLAIFLWKQINKKK